MFRPVWSVGDEPAPGDRQAAPRADQRRLLARRAAAQQVHLEETLLRMDEAERVGGVVRRVRRYRHHALSIAFDAR